MAVANWNQGSFRHGAFDCHDGKEAAELPSAVVDLVILRWWILQLSIAIENPLGVLVTPICLLLLTDASSHTIMVIIHLLYRRAG